METFYQSVSQLKEAMQAKGVTLACTVCGAKEFSMEEAEIRGSRGSESGHYLGNQRLSRSQVVCHNCGHVMSFEVEKLR